MDNKSYKNLINYQNNIDLVKSSIFEIVDFVNILGISEKMAYESLWNLSKEISYSFSNFDPDYPGVKQEQKIFSLFPVQEARLFLADFRLFLESAGFFEPKIKYTENNDYISNDLTQKFLSFDLPSTVVMNFSPKKITSENISSFIIRIDDLKKEYQGLKEKIGAIAAYMGFFSHIRFYSDEEINNIIESGSDNIDFIKLSGAVRESLWSDHGRSLSLIILNFLNNQAVFDAEDYSWHDTFIIHIFLHQVFYHFVSLVDIDQEFLLNYYFYKAIVVGAPVQEALKMELYETDNVVDFVDVDKYFYECIIDNKEEIIVEFETKQKEKLSKILQDFLLVAGDKIHDGYKLETFLNNLYSKTNNKSYIKNLREVFYIFTHLKTVDLLDRNIGSIPSDDLIYNTELEALILWFFDKETWSLILEYYNKSEPFVPLKSFLRQLVNNFDIKDEDNLQKIFDFTNFLKQNSLLSSDEDLVHFDEQKNEFVWSS